MKIDLLDRWALLLELDQLGVDDHLECRLRVVQQDKSTVLRPVYVDQVTKLMLKNAEKCLLKNADANVHTNFIHGRASRFLTSALRSSSLLV